MGYLVPTFAHVLYPGDIANVPRVVDVHRLDPFTYPIMDTLHACHDWFFVPFHHLFEGWERFLTQLVTDAPNSNIEASYTATMNSLPYVPYGWNFADTEQRLLFLGGSDFVSSVNIPAADMQQFRGLWGEVPNVSLAAPASVSINGSLQPRLLAPSNPPYAVGMGVGSTLVVTGSGLTGDSLLIEYVDAWQGTPGDVNRIGSTARATFNELVTAGIFDNVTVAGGGSILTASIASTATSVFYPISQAFFPAFNPAPQTTRPFINQVANYSTGIFTQFGIIPPTNYYLDLEDSSLPYGLQHQAFTRPTAGQGTVGPSLAHLNGMMFLAYHKIIDDYYRDQEMEYPSMDWPLDYVKHATGTNNTTPEQSEVYCPVYANGMINPNYWAKGIRKPRVDTASLVTSTRPYGDPDHGFLLRRANWENDYLTTRRPAPQRGQTESITIGADGMFSIDELRAATAEQNKMLAQQRSGGQLRSYYMTFFGETDADSSYGICDSLGRDVQGLDVTDIYQTSATPVDTAQGLTPQGNPVAYSRTVSQGGGVKYHARSMGVLMRLSCVKPQSTYVYGIDPMFTLSSEADYFNPKREAIGWQPVPRSHVFPVKVATNSASDTSSITPDDFNAVSGWQPPYEDARRKLSYVCSGFNHIYGDVDFSARTFARDFSGLDATAVSSNPLLFPGLISPTFRKCDPTNSPFAYDSDSPTQVQHYMEYTFYLRSVIPHAINLRCLTH